MDVGYGGVWVSIYIGASVAAVWIISADMGVGVDVILDIGASVV